MNLISYWTEVTSIYEDDELTLITGRYNHKNEHEIGDKCLGVHWGNFPQSHNILSPCVIPEATRNAMLSGLLHKATVEGDLETIDQIRQAIIYLNN